MLDEREEMVKNEGQQYAKPVEPKDLNAQRSQNREEVVADTNKQGTEER